MPSPNPARILKQHLQTDALLGAATVPTPTPIQSASQAHGVAPATATGPRPTPNASPPQEAPHRRASSPPRSPIAPPAAAAPLPPAARADIKLLDGLTTADKQARLQALQAEFEQDDQVQRLRPPGTNLVFGEGDPDAKLMFIGEGPGQEEDRTGRPFVGPAGELLDKMITAMGLTRESVYIANVVKYRPPGNRTPTTEEAAVQGPYLAKQVAIVRPTALVALGGAAAKYALATTTGITRLRGQWAHFVHTDPTLPVMPTFHPAYLLRSYTTDNRKKVWADLQAAMTKLDG